jgi:hypothetical protein
MAKKKEPRYDEITAEVRAEQPYARDDYEPVFDRDGTTRRVLGHITDQEDAFATMGAGTAPRNTVSALTIALMRDENTPGVSADDMAEAAQRVEADVAELIEAGFVVERDDGTLELTDDGLVELSN